METPGSKILQASSGAPSGFRAWLADALFFQKELFGELVQALKICGIAQDESQALEYLSRLAQESGQNPKNHLALGDISGERKVAYAAELKRRLNAKVGPSADPYRFLGKIAHLAIPGLFVSDLHLRGAKLPREQSDRQEALPFGSFDPQLDFFEETNGKGSFEQRTDGRNLSWRSARTVFKAVERALQDARQILESEDQQYYRLSIKKLARALVPVFGAWTEKVEEYPAVPNYAILAALMSWASAALYYWHRTGRRVLFREMAVMSPGRGFSGGRLDAMELVRLDGERFKKSELKMLSRLLTYPVRSAGHLLWELRNFQRLELAVRVIDWKFVTGDSPTGGIIKSADISSGPISDHAEQVQWYLSLAVVDSLHFGGRRLEPFSWHRFLEQRQLEGRLEYFLPSDVVVHPVASSSSELQENLIEIAEGFKEAPARAMRRGLWNLFLRHALEKLKNGNGENHENGGMKRSSAVPVSAPLFPDERNAIPFVRRYQRPRTFLDGRGIIEIVAHNREGKPVYEMRYDRLLEAIEAGSVEVGRNFQPGRNSHISCVMPEHPERTPSMRIFIQDPKPSFHCFGCWAHGYVNVMSVPVDLDVVVKPGSGKFGRLKPGALPAIPEEHHKLMGLAQELLQSEFRKSEGERYLAKERYLDTDLAFQMGAGFGSWRLMDGLMDAGYKLDDLIKSGLVLVSEKVTPKTGIGPLLQRRGLAPSEMARVVGRSRKSGEITGYPWSMLQGRVTFPLRYEGRSTNFYGRATGELGLKHVKTSNGFEQGGFNMEVLDSGCEEVILVEAAICVVTLVQMGYECGIGMIGSSNHSILDCIVRSGKKLALGLDIDPNRHQTGQKKAATILEALQERGFARARNFTAEFVAAGGLETFKDWNEDWVRRGRFLTPKN